MKSKNLRVDFFFKSCSMLFARYYNQITQSCCLFKAINCLVNSNYKSIILEQLKNSRFVFLKRNN